MVHLHRPPVTLVVEFFHALLGKISVYSPAALWYCRRVLLSLPIEEFGFVLYKEAFVMHCHD
jgi:hypothetical protein